MTANTARCLCGTVQVEFDGSPKFCIQCYCTDCQHVSGGGSAPQLGLEAGKVRMSGPLREYRAKSSRGNDLVFGFCGECGSPIFKTTTMAPDLVFLYAGALDDASLFANPRKVFEDSRLPWDES